VAPAIVRRALDLGVTVFDTAELYGWGNSERILGAAVRDRRGEAFLATKILPVLPIAAVVRWRGRRSASRLGVDVIDLYQVHWPNPFVPIRSTMRGMRRLQDDGVIRHVGVSNFSVKAWERASEALGRPVLSNQVQFSLAVPGAMDTVIPFAAANDRLVMAYSPLAWGLLSGRYDEQSVVPDDIRRHGSMFTRQNLRRAAPLLELLRDVARTHNATPAQIALAWILLRPNTIAIPGASRVDQMESNAAAADLELSDEEDRALTAASVAFAPRRGLAAVPEVAVTKLRRYVR
jgi:aryl-alcohol dehydrogenase-like predicted oxidoreductase